MRVKRILIMFVVTLFISWVIAILPTRQAAAEPLLDFLGGSAQYTVNAHLASWAFTLSSPITVGALGFWDEGANGLVNGHNIGLWSSDGSSLASTYITDSNSTPVASSSTAGDWRFTTISQLTLNPGEYVLGATFHNMGDVDKYRTGTATSLISGASFIGADDSAALFANQQQVPLDFPGLPSGTEVPHFGANLLVIQPSGVPEPSTLILLGFGLVGLAGVRRKMQK